MQLTFSAFPPPYAPYRQGALLPTPYSSGVRFCQVADSNVSPKTLLQGTRDIVWANNAPLSFVPSSVYITSIRDDDRTRDITWYKANQPDWVVYQNDQVSPSIDFQYSGYFLVALDFKNPAVRAYKLAQCLAMKALGFNTIAFDNVSLRNNGVTKRAGVFTSSTYDGSGNRLTGTWVQQYDGTVADDQLYRTALIEYIAWMRGQLNANGMLLMINATLALADAAGAGDSKRLFAQADRVLFESYIYSNGVGVSPTDSSWAQFFNVVTDYTLRGGVALFVMYEGTSLPSDMSQANEAWMIANFLLVKGPWSYFSFGNYGDFVTYPPHWNPAVGYPTEAPHQVGSVYQRRYSTGFVVVNPSSTVSASYTVPSGTWADQFGNTVAAGAQTLAAKSGIVLVGG